VAKRDAPAGAPPPHAHLQTQHGALLGQVSPAAAPASRARGACQGGSAIVLMPMQGAMLGCACGRRRHGGDDETRGVSSGEGADPMRGAAR